MGRVWARVLPLAVFISMVFGVAAVQAAEPAPAPQSETGTKRRGGITISPAFQDVTLDPTKATENYTFSVTNNTSEPYEFALSVVDFGNLDETGGVAFVGDANKSLNYRYGLTSWATLERDRIVVEPRTTEKVPVTITNRESLTPGGHYGAVLVSPTESPERPTRVQIDQVLSSLLFVKKLGGEVYNLSLKSYDVRRSLFSTPDKVDMRFQNAGNVHVVPRGTISVTDPRGRQVQKGIVNSSSAIVLPETFRRLSVPLESMGASWLPGKYTMQITYRFDGSDATQTRTVSYYYVNSVYVLIGLITLLGLIAIACSKKLRRRTMQLAKIPYIVLENRFKNRRK